MAPKFIFVRHGEAEHNVAFHEKKDENVFSDPKYKDAKLTAKGIEQAQKTGVALSELPILDIWCSPLTRCIQTAEEIFEEASVQNIYLHDSLLEWLGANHLCNERLTKTELKKTTFWNMTYLPETPPTWIEKETYSSLYQRMFSFLKFLAEVYKDIPDTQHVVIVSHLNSILALTKKDLKNAEYVILSLDDIKPPEFR